MFNLFVEIFRSFKKSKAIKRLTLEYIDTRNDLNKPLSLINQFSQFEKKDEIINKIIQMSLDEPNNYPVIKKFKINKESLKNTFLQLEILGCSCYAKGHLVSISALLYPQTLEFIYYKKRKTVLEKNQMAIELIKYFDQNKTGNIVNINYD